MAVLLALTAAASWGASDFLGGFAGRRATRDVTVALALTTQGLGLVGLWGLAAVVGGASPSTADVWFAAGAGAGGGVGVTLLYRGLARGTMSVVAPITGAGAAAIPVVYGVASGEAPPRLAWVGVVAALVAIVLVSREPGDADRAARVEDTGRLPPGVLDAIGAGIGFGALFILLDRTAPGTGLWVLVPMKLSATLLLLVVGLAARRPLLPPAGVWLPVLGVGILDNAANAAYLLATRRGIVAIVAVLSSLYPIATVLLARGVLGERLHRNQIGGLALALAGVGLIAAA